MIHFIGECYMVSADGSSTSLEVIKVLTEVAKVVHNLERVKDQAVADEFFKRLAFEKYEDNVHSIIIRGIPLDEYVNVINNLITLYKIPENIGAMILVVKGTEGYEKEAINFTFTGNDDVFNYGRIALSRRGDKMDLAYSVYSLKFKISSLVVEHEKRTTFLGFTTSVEVWHDTKEFSFSDNQSEFLKVHFTNKTIKAFESMHTSRGLVRTVVDFLVDFLLTNIFCFDQLMIII